MLAYHLFRAACKPIECCCIPSTIIHAERLDRSGACILAPTHNSHLEPFVLSLLLRGRVRWMARSEFYKHRLVAKMMDGVGAFRVARRGYARPALREGLRLLNQDERIGVFPEGGVARRQYSAMRGGPITHGACFLAMHSGAPIIPIAVVGTHAMNRVGPWLPFRKAAVHVAIGEPIEPGPLPESLYDRHIRRGALGELMLEQYQSLYRELLALPGVDDDHDLHPGQDPDPARVAYDPDSAAGIAASRRLRYAPSTPVSDKLSPVDV
ncbi:MAG: lysophospholipid acyltransferase family protein [Phycisphaeraceae bacterium]